MYGNEFLGGRRERPFFQSRTATVVYAVGAPRGFVLFFGDGLSHCFFRGIELDELQRRENFRKSGNRFRRYGELSENVQGRVFLSRPEKQHVYRRRFRVRADSSDSLLRTSCPADLFAAAILQSMVYLPNVISTVVIGILFQSFFLNNNSVYMEIVRSSIPRRNIR